MTHLVVCHDIGNTTVLLKAANTLLAKDKTKAVLFLIIGVAAKKIFDNKANAHHNVIAITDWLPDTTLENLNDRAFTAAEKLIVAAKIAELNPEHSIVGSSSFSTALAPYQIIEILTKQKQLLLAEEKPQSAEQIYVGDYVRIANFDFLQDKINNPVWSLLSKEWAAHISFLLAFAEEAQRMMAVNQQLTCHAVSSPELDEVFEMEFDDAKIKKTLELLEVAEGRRLLFISGSKVIADDLALLQALHYDLKEQDHTVVRMGLHPGTKDMDKHVSMLLDWLNRGCHPGFPSFPLRIIITDSVKAQLSATTLQSTRLLCVDLSGNDVFLAANSVASPQPTTLATKGVVLGKPSYCLPDYVGLSYVALFFKSKPIELIQREEKIEKLTKKDMQLPDGKAVDVISDMLLGMAGPRIGMR